jgi:hypothetical protein
MSQLLLFAIIPPNTANRRNGRSMDKGCEMERLDETSLEWAKKHLKNYFDSDFFPKMFEFKCIESNWEKVKIYLLNLEFGRNGYTPKSPLHYLAYKNPSSFRVVHQLDPIDSIIFTALVHQVAESIEEYRIPENRDIACSYRIRPTADGSFFNKDENGWKKYRNKIKSFLDKEEGYIIECDIVDFYNQIYTHRIQNIISESGKGELEKISNNIEIFLMGLNKNTSRGVPVGPAASIVLAEAVMRDIDEKLLRITSNFTRWVDDIKIYCKTLEEAEFILHELTDYLYSPHRLVLSSEKTHILSIEEYNDLYSKDEASIEQEHVLEEAESLVIDLIDDIEAEFEGDDPYSSPEYDYEELLVEVLEGEKLKLLSNAYERIIQNNIDDDYNTGLLRHIYRRAGIVRLKGIIRFTLENLEYLLPVLREVVIFLNKVLSEKNIKKYEKEFERIIKLERLWKNRFFNRWFSFLFQNDFMNELDVDVEYRLIHHIRDKALIALRKKDLIWIKEYKENIDSLSDWDKRAVLYSSQILSYDEMSKWGTSVTRNDIVLDSILKYIKDIKKMP